MDQKLGQENMAVVGRWPLVEVRLYENMTYSRIPIS